MWDALKSFIQYMEEETSKDLTAEEKEKLNTELQIKIGYFQHERLIHLIVTVLFSLCTIISIMGFIAFESIGIALLFVALMVLLVPYIVHYFRMENGVQKLYTYYEKLK
jgi:Ca2+/Na+ antiporter